MSYPEVGLTNFNSEEESRQSKYAKHIQKDHSTFLKPQVVQKKVLEVVLLTGRTSLGFRYYVYGKHGESIIFCPGYRCLFQENSQA